MPIVTVLVGLPGSGKSTSIPEYFDGFIYSTDNYIESCAKMNGITYTEAFPEFIGQATKHMNKQVEISIRQRADIIWDQTNLTSKKRRGILSRFPDSYARFCACRVPPRDDLEFIDLVARLQDRSALTGKTIPLHLVEQMMSSYVEPTCDEGFDMISLFDIYGKPL